MLTCKEAGRLVSEGLDRRLPFWRRLALRFHVLLCRGCARYAHQISTLNRLISDHYRNDPPADVSQHLSDRAREHIKLSLRRVAHGTNHPTGE